MLGHGETRTMAHLDPRINKVMVPTALDQLLDVQTEWVWRLALDGVLAVAWIIRALDRRLIWSTVDNGSSLQIQGRPLFPTLGEVVKPLLYNSVISSWNNAGITPVFAIGNSGSACGTAGSPGDQSSVISVGATTNTNNAMASFSSRGPARNTNLLKPEVSAPGSSIVSCGTGTSNYVTMSGTSMATPHVAGAVALIRQCLSTTSLTTIRNALYTTAVTPTLTSADRSCGLVNPGEDFPNCAFGYGKIDVGRAVGQ